ncbi:MAG: hypothetical protein ABJK10_10740, partial [Rhodopirellula bahusiensis]
MPVARSRVIAEGGSVDASEDPAIRQRNRQFTPGGSSPVWVEKVAFQRSGSGSKQIASSIKASNWSFCS